MHTNSLIAHKEITKTGQRKTRRDLVQEVYQAQDKLTDRMVLNVLFPGSDDCNKVKPRISELLLMGLLEECGKIRCPITGKQVRLVKVAGDTNQVEMF